MNPFPNPIGISVLIFGYNSTPRIMQVLQHIADQNISSEIKWEVILMENASKDNTAELGIQIWKEIGKSIPFKVVKENKEGLIYSRMTAIETALYEYIVFVDDDNLLEQKYLHGVYNIMSEHSNIGAVGGKIEAVYETSPPKWLKKIETSLAIGLGEGFIIKKMSESIH